MIVEAEPLHVCHAVLSLDVGGLERMVIALARQGLARGQRVSVLCLERPGGLAKEAAAAGVAVHCLDKEPGRRLDLDRLEPVLTTDCPDVLHTHQVGPLYHAGAAARRAGVPLVVHTEHGSHLKGLSPWHRRLRTRHVWRSACRSAARVFCVSREIAEQFDAAAIAPAKVCVVPNGVEAPSRFDPADIARLRRRWGIEPGQPIVGAVGRLAEIKRQDSLLRVFARVRRHLPAARLLLVGDGPERAALVELSRDLGIADGVIFAGYQPQPEAYYALMDVHVLTSRSEGLPVSILEAWAAGRPVVATAVGGVPDLIEEGLDGFHRPFGDERGLAAAIAAVLTDRDLAQRLGEAGRHKVRARYSVGTVAQTYETAYRELLEDSPCASSR